MNFLIKDSSGKKSATMTAFVLGFIVVNLKLIFSGITVGSFTIASFTGGEYSSSLISLGAIYVLRRNFGNTDESNKDNK